MKRRNGKFITIVLACCCLVFSGKAYAEADIMAVEKPFLEGRYDKAEYEAQRMIDQKARQRHELYYLKGLSELKLNKFKEARESFETIISKYPGSSRVFDAYIGIGDSCMLSSDTSGAAKAYTEALGKFPKDKNVAIARSRLNDCVGKVSVPTVSAQSNSIIPTRIPQSEIGKYFSVQAGCFKSNRNAENLSNKLNQGGYDSYVELPLSSGDKLYRVKVGKLKSKSEADSLAQKLNRSGYKTKICDNSVCQ